MAVYFILLWTMGCNTDMRIIYLSKTLLLHYLLQLRIMLKRTDVPIIFLDQWNTEK